MFIDGLTGFKRTRYEFLERVGIAAAALTTSQSGLQLEPTDIVAVLSENCLVSIGFVLNRALGLTIPRS
jgi:hypothetical protein